MSTVAEKLNRLKQLESRKEPWLPMFQILGEYIHTRKQNFTTSQIPGEFLMREIFDSMGPKSAKTSSSALVGMLWPANARKIQLTKPSKLPDTTVIKTYYDDITRVLHEHLDNPKARLANVLAEYMLDQVVFGTSGVEPFEDEDLGVKYRAWGVKEIYLSEGRAGEVETIYLKLQFDVERMVAEYGYDKVSKKTRERYDKNQFEEKVDLLITIEPRRSKKRKANSDLRFQSMHIEIDSKHILKESGFEDLPIKIGRFWKILGEEYGRSPGMDAAPDILESNAIWESVTIAIEKNLDPPLGVLDDGRLGAGEIDTSAGAINVFNIAGRAGEQNPVFPINTVGEIKQTVNLLERLAQNISDHFFIDRLLDFNNQVQMTLGEAQLRNRLRHNTLGSILVNQISDVFNPLIERTFNILFKQGKLGVIEGSPEHAMALFEGKDPIVIPREVAELMARGEDVYGIEYFTPAMRIIQAEEAEGIFRAWEMAGFIGNMRPDATDVLDADKSLKRFTELTGAPLTIVRSQQAIDIIRDERDKQMQAAQQAEMAKAASEAARNIGQSGLVPTQRPKELVA
jgi:hypothetical protein